MKSDYSYLMEQVVSRLLGPPKSSRNNELRYGNKGSLSIDIAKAGFIDWETDEKGGVFELIKRETGRDPIEWLRDNGLSVPRSPAQPKPQKPRQDYRPHARLIWQQTEPAVGTLVETYLRSRAITIPPPPSLRFHRALPHREGSSCPAMVAIVTTGEKEFLGIHRTWLKPDGSGKADVEPQKMALGSCAGGAARLGPVAEKLYLAEGIETALSIMQVTGGSVWATLGTSGLKNINCPPEVREVVICADSGVEEIQAAEKAARRLLLQGKRVSIARPPPGQDFNDVLREEAGI